MAIYVYIKGMICPTNYDSLWCIYEEWVSYPIPVPTCRFLSLWRYFLELDILGGIVSHDQNPDHVYQGICRYTVPLDVSDAWDQSLMRTSWDILTSTGKMNRPKAGWFGSRHPRLAPVCMVSRYPSGKLHFTLQVYPQESVRSGLNEPDFVSR